MKQGSRALSGILWALRLVTEVSPAFLERKAARGVLPSTANVIGCDMPFTVFFFKKLSISFWDKSLTKYMGICFTLTVIHYGLDILQ